LSQAREFNRTAVTKSGMMVGLGETMDEIVQTMEDLRKVDCELLTIGQYLRPSQKHAPISKWYTPKEFEELRKQGENLGFKNVASGPLVRSSYHAEEQHEAASLLTAIQ
jgi:lipoic acid synthetase